ncbi:MAG: hypothetical protein HY928_17400 [Elusimicrobia bacterium]|nr:hypothetical protein [Elusimicrobiota bacterium]
MKTIKRVVLGLFSAATRLTALALTGTMGIFLGAMVLEGWKEALDFPGVPQALALYKEAQGPLIDALRAKLPPVFGGFDAAPWIFFAGLLAMWAVLLAQNARINYHVFLMAQEKRNEQRARELEAERLERQREYKESVARMEREAKERADREAVERARRMAELEMQHKSVEALKAREAQRRADEARIAHEAQLREIEEERLALEARRQAEAEAAQKAAAEQAMHAPQPPARAPEPVTLSGGVNKPRSREELLELMAHAKKQLELQKRALSFLSIDVVDSTGMKVGEDPSIATRDFKHYRKLVEKAIADHKGLKAAWTPDGVMICFPTAETAVGAAKQVIRDLEDFNKNVKAMRRDFKVRCGVNSGTVLFDDTVPMEEMSDRSIDIAGHMQKYAEANAIFLGKHVVAEMRAADEFVPASREVDGCEVYAWRSQNN